MAQNLAVRKQLFAGGAALPEPGAEPGIQDIVIAGTNDERDLNARKPLGGPVNLRLDRRTMKQVEQIARNRDGVEIASVCGDPPKPRLMKVKVRNV